MGRPELSAASVAAFRDRAIATALEMFATQPDVSLRQLARAMGVSPTTPYRYFESKEELFMAVRATCFRRFAGFLRRRLAPLDDPIAAVFEVAAGYHRYAHDNPAEFGLMFQLGQPDPRRHQVLHEAGVEAWSVVLETVERAHASGHINADVLGVAHLLWAGVHGVVSLSETGRLTVGRSVDDLVRPMVAALLRAHGWEPS